MEISQVNPTTSALCYIIETLSQMESAPFGVLPTRLTPPIPQELSAYSPQLLLIKRKAHAMCMRLFSAENAALGLRNVDLLEEVLPPIVSPATTMEDHILEIKSTVKHLVTLHTEEAPPPSPQPETSFQIDTNSKLEQILNLVLEHNFSMSAASEDTTNALAKLVAIQEGIKDMLYEVRSFPDKMTPSARGPADIHLDPFAKSNDPRCKCVNPLKCSCDPKAPGEELEKLKAETHQIEKELAELKAEVNTMASLLSDCANGDLPGGAEYSPDDLPEVISLKAAFVALLTRISTITGYTDQVSQGVRSGLGNEIMGRDLPLSGIWMKLREDIDTAIKLQQVQDHPTIDEDEIWEVIGRLRDTCFGELPPIFDIVGPDSQPTVQLKKLVNLLITDIRYFSGLLAKSKVGFFDRTNLAVPSVDLDGVWRSMQSGLLALWEHYKSLESDVANQVESLVSGEFDSFSEYHPVAHPSIKSLGEKLRCYRDDHKRFCDEVGKGNLNITMPIPKKLDGAWTDMRLASSHMTRKLVRDIGALSGVLSVAVRGDLNAASVSQTLKNESLGSFKKLIGWIEQLLISVREYHRDVDDVVKGVVSGKAAIPYLPATSYTGEWKKSRTAINDMVARLGKGPS